MQAGKQTANQNIFNIVRVAVPIIIGLGFYMYHDLDNLGGGAVRWPAIMLWILAAMLIVGFNIQNKNRPAKLLIAIPFLFTLGAIVYVYGALSGLNLFGSMFYGNVTFMVIALFLFVTSIYLPTKK
jgi:peptidoglycan/LPS O-acetylase OafA/YrhL